jgi:hypothetical protein
MISIHSVGAAARLVAIAGFGVAALAGPAQARPSEAQLSAIKSNCRSDYMANCMSVRPGGPEALQCLQSHLASLSDACKAAVSATLPPPPPPAAAAPPPAPPPPKAAAAPPRAVPPPPAAAAAPPSPRKAATAPKAKKARTAKRAPAPPPPPVAVAPPPPPPGPDPAVLMARAERLPPFEKLKIARACSQDQAAVCPSVPPGGGRLIVCMALHPDALSPFCRRALAAALR